MPTPAIPIMHTDKAKTLCTAREVTGSQRFILSAMYQGSTKTSDQTSVSFRGSTPCNTRGVHINFSEAAFLSAITQRQSMHWRIARIEKGHIGGGDGGSQLRVIVPRQLGLGLLLLQQWDSRGSSSSPLHALVRSSASRSKAGLGNERASDEECKKKG
jgi:hypothetical protein